jgi:hypothetical protein
MLRVAARAVCTLESRARMQFPKFLLLSALRRNPGNSGTSLLLSFGWRRETIRLLGLAGDP